MSWVGEPSLISLRRAPCATASGETPTTRMSLSFWLGIGVGVGIMGLHTVLRAVTHRVALQQSASRSFLVFELGGLAVRMALVFGASAVVLLFVPVDKLAFIATVLALLIVSMILETRYVLRHLDRDGLR